MPPLAISERQIIAGPNYISRMDGKTVRTLNVPWGRYDLSALISSLPADQKPDLTIVLADANQDCLPQRLAEISGRKLLLIGDTHNAKTTRSPLRTMLTYARQEPFDRIVVTHDPHHLHWFREANIAPTTYIPNINCAYFPVPFDEQRRPAIVFIGQSGQYHPRRRYLLQEVENAGLPLIVQRASPPVAATLYNSIQIAFNCSLNGDFNMRVFEVMAAGGFLVTDRLSPQSGLGTIFRSGEHYVEYGDLNELLELLRHYLAHPDECLKIAKAGHEAYLKKHHPQQRVRDLLDFAFGGAPAAYCSDPRAVQGSYDFGKSLHERVRLYELLQNLSLQNERIIVVADPALGARAISDLVDLPRLRIIISDMADTSSAFKEALRDLDVLNQVEFVGTRTPQCDIQLVHRRTIESRSDTLSLHAQFVAGMTDKSTVEGQVRRLMSHGFREISEGDMALVFERLN